MLNIFNQVHCVIDVMVFDDYIIQTREFLNILFKIKKNDQIYCAL